MHNDSHKPSQPYPMSKNNKFKTFAMALLSLGLVAPTVQATVLDFNSGVTSGITLGGGMMWHANGGGHLYNEFWDNDDLILFADSNTYVNSFQMNALPWMNYGSAGGFIDVDARNVVGEVVWRQTLDLRPYTTWSNWLTVNVNTPNVAQLYFHAPGNSPHFNAFWPSIDNLVINQASAAAAASAVPEGGMTMALLGVSLAGLVLLRRNP